MTPADLTAHLVAEMERVPGIRKQEYVGEGRIEIWHEPDFPALARVAQRVIGEAHQQIYDCSTCGLEIHPVFMERVVLSCPDCHTYTAKRRALSPEAQEEGR